MLPQCSKSLAREGSWQGRDHAPACSWKARWPGTSATALIACHKTTVESLSRASPQKEFPDDKDETERIGPCRRRLRGRTGADRNPVVALHDRREQRVGERPRQGFQRQAEGLQGDAR